MGDRERQDGAFMLGSGDRPACDEAPFELKPACAETTTWRTTMSPSNPPQTDGPAPLTRREFLGTTACAVVAATFPSIIPSSALGRDGAVAPSNRMTVGVIGCGPQ